VRTQWGRREAAKSRREAAKRETPRLRPDEKALQVAQRLGACAGALRNASGPRDS